ncbi:hypothetical protein [Leptolyngbya sp. O-77]|uniref:hypothetical protein n=1 Tax=Leptolyngbya sp. O-77 TaxID=1080068 RepID=UPI000A56C217|nr:hypothetical protein [Leptolyngbya sp. O-77]
MNEPLPDASRASSGDQPILFEAALQAADAAVLATAARHLKNIEVAVLKGAWHGFKYDEIAEETGYTPEYIKHDVGPKLWQLLSSSLGERVSKTNLVAVLSQRAAQPPSSSPSRNGATPNTGTTEQRGDRPLPITLPPSARARPRPARRPRRA